jgi:hypothetical protein
MCVMGGRIAWDEAEWQVKMHSLRQSALSISPPEADPVPWTPKPMSCWSRYLNVCFIETADSENAYRRHPEGKLVSRPVGAKPVRSQLSHKWLNRRSQRSKITWERFSQFKPI